MDTSSTTSISHASLADALLTIRLLIRRVTGWLTAAMGVLVLILACAGCARGDTEPSDQPSEATPDASPATVGVAELDGSTFVSTSVSGYELVEGTDLTLTFQDGLMTATAGCNTLFGPYEVEQDTLRWIGTPATSLMECPEAEDAQDRWVTGLLSEGVTAMLQGSVLTLSAGVVKLELAAAE